VQHPPRRTKLLGATWHERQFRYLISRLSWQCSVCCGGRCCASVRLRWPGVGTGSTGHFNAKVSAPGIPLASVGATARAQSLPRARPIGRTNFRIARLVRPDLMSWRSTVVKPLAFKFLCCRPQPCSLVRSADRGHAPTPVRRPDSKRDRQRLRRPQCTGGHCAPIAFIQQSPDLTRMVTPGNLATAWLQESLGVDEKTAKGD